MREVRLALLEADVSYKVVRDFIKTVSERAVGTDVLESLTPAQMVIKIVNEELTSLMGGENTKIKISSKPPTVVMLVGLQWLRQTTERGQAGAYMASTMGKRPLLVACDNLSSAAIRQLETVGKQLDIPSFKWDTANLWICQKPPSNTPSATGTTWCFSIRSGRLHIDKRAHGELVAIKAAYLPRRSFSLSTP
jgi:signal recognition particle subunit SRP54